MVLKIKLHICDLLTTHPHAPFVIFSRAVTIITIRSNRP